MQVRHAGEVSTGRMRKQGASVSNWPLNHCVLPMLGAIAVKLSQRKQLTDAVGHTWHDWVQVSCVVTAL